MLILARYRQETIFIGEVQVTILDIVRRKHGRTRVKLGIEAPPEILIRRAELPPRPPGEKTSLATTSGEMIPGDQRAGTRADAREETEA